MFIYCTHSYNYNIQLMSKIPVDTKIQFKYKCYFLHNNNYTNKKNQLESLFTHVHKIKILIIYSIHCMYIYILFKAEKPILVVF